MSAAAARKGQGLCAVEMEENGLMTERVQGSSNLMVNEIDAGLMRRCSLRYN